MNPLSPAPQQASGASEFVAIASLPPSSSFEDLFSSQEPSELSPVPPLTVVRTGRKAELTVQKAPIVKANNQKACFMEIGSQGESVVVVKRGKEYSLLEFPQGIDEEKFLKWGELIIKWYKKMHFA